MNQSKLYFRFLLAAALILLLVWLVPGLAKSRNDKLFLSILSAVNLLVSILGTQKILKNLNISQARFNAVYFGTMGLRMLSALILILIYLIYSPVVNKVGVIFLICLYFVFLGFEIRLIQPKLRTDSEKSKNTDDARK